MDENSLFTQALIAIEAGDRALARRLLANLVRGNPRHELAWLRLASVVDDRHQVADCLQRVLAINPNNVTAREWLDQVNRVVTQPFEARAILASTILDDEILLAEPGDEERPVPRLGQYLLDYQFITGEQLKHALLVQRSSIGHGQPRRIGDILLSTGAITAERLDFAVREQHRSFYSLFDE